MEFFCNNLIREKDCKAFLTYLFITFTDFEVYLKSKIAEVHQASNEEKASCYSDPQDAPRRYAAHKYGKQLFHLIDSNSMRKSITTGSKASVYYTPNDSVDQAQAQVQLSPMHINYIRENLDTYIDCMKPAASDNKFDFDMHQLQASLEQEVHRRRSRHLRQPSDEYDSAVEEIGEIDTEQTKMLNHTDDMEAGTSGHCIRMNTLPRRKSKRNTNLSDCFYSMENVFDGNMVNGDFDIHHSNKTIDEATETLLTSSASDNCSSSEINRSSQPNPSQSELVLNGTLTRATALNDWSNTCNSMPNIIDSTIAPDKQSTNDMQCNRIDNLPNVEHSPSTQLTD